jgi:hypothetical protein
VHQASALAPFDDLGVLQTGQWPPPRLGISPWGVAIIDLKT